MIECLLYIYVDIVDFLFLIILSCDPVSSYKSQKEESVTSQMDSNTLKRPDRVFVLKSIDWNWNYYDNY